MCLTGGNKTAARLAGVQVSRAIVVIYTICGFMAGVGAIDHTLGGGQPRVWTMQELQSTSADEMTKTD